MTKPLNTTEAAALANASGQPVIGSLPKPPQSPSAASELPTKATMPAPLAKALGYRQS